MDFDIHQLDDVEIESGDADEAFDTFQRAVLDRFDQSPEGQERRKADSDMGFWASELMHYGWEYEGSSLAQMTVGVVRTVVSGLFPRKISLFAPEQANDAIPELIAFWKFLKREYQLPQADAVLGYLQQIEPDYFDTMNDPASFGMAKSFFMMGRAAGFDMTTQDGMNAFMAAFNAGRLGQPMRLGSAMRPSLSCESSHRPGPADRKAEKKWRRKRAQEALARSRQRRK